MVFIAKVQLNKLQLPCNIF